MRCLWLTLADPEPAQSGQFLYSGGLLKATAQSGAEVELLGLGRRDSPRQDGERSGGIRWWSGGYETLSHAASLASPLPHIAYRCRTPRMRRRLHGLLERDDWDCIIFDGISSGWALRPVLRRYTSRRRPRLVYVSHNHEASTRAQIAANHPPGWRRQAIRFDAAKVAVLERALVDAVDLVTAITDDDRALYLAARPDKRIEVLTPGYRGREVNGRCITRDLPRRAVIVGTFEWIAKRLNLVEFVSVADPIFAAAGAELQVVGSAQESFLAELRRQVTATSFTGTVESVHPFLDESRIAIVPERNGGGFKLKVLDYVFNRIPILALRGSVAGLPLSESESILLYPDHRALAEGVLRAIDDLDLLNRLQDLAYRACRDKFDWASRGRQLLSAVASL
jgi:glycosyltransferase involved in cell wall biosynthesis